MPKGQILVVDDSGLGGKICSEILMQDGLEVLTPLQKWRRLAINKSPRL